MIWQRAYGQQNKERIRSNRQKYGKDNREGVNEYLRGYYAKNKGRITQKPLHQKQRKTDMNMVRFGVWDQGSGKLETNLSVTQCGIPTSETSSTTATCEKP